MESSLGLDEEQELRQAAHQPTPQSSRIDWLLVSIIIAGLAARLFAVLDWNSFSRDAFTALRGDEPGYANTARELLNGYGFTWPGRVPGYPAFLAVLLWISSGSIHMVRVWQCLCGIPLIVLTFVLARRLVGVRAAYIASTMAAFTLPLARQPVSIMSEVLYTPLLILIGLLTVRAFQQPSFRTFGWLGFATGLSDLIRPTLLLYPAAIALALLFILPWKRAVQCALWCAALALIVVLPWLVHNWIRFHAPILATSNALLWQASPEYYHLTHEKHFTYQDIWGGVLYAKNMPDPTSIPGDRYWTHRALVSIRAEPLTYVLFAAEKLVTYWTGDFVADWNNGPLFDYNSLLGVGFSPSMAIKSIVARAIPVLSLVAMVILWPQRRMLIPIYVLLAYTTLFHAATHAEVRLSEPFLPFLLILVAGAMPRAGAVVDGLLNGRLQRRAQTATNG